MYLISDAPIIGSIIGIGHYRPLLPSRKGMVIILCVCVCVCSQTSGKTTKIGGSNELLADFKLYKDQK